MSDTNSVPDEQDPQFLPPWLTDGPEWVRSVLGFGFTGPLSVWTIIAISRKYSWDSSVRPISLEQIVAGAPSGTSSAEFRAQIVSSVVDFTGAVFTWTIVISLLYIGIRYAAWRHHAFVSDAIQKALQDRADESPGEGANF